MTIPHSNPEKCRERIVQLLKGLTSQGYGLHLFEPRWFEPEKPGEKKPFRSPTVIPGVNKKDIIHGIGDACADDALWLIPAITEYIKETGDFSFADLKVPYADSPVLASPERGGDSGRYIVTDQVRENPGTEQVRENPGTEQVRENPGTE